MEGPSGQFKAIMRDNSINLAPNWWLVSMIVSNKWSFGRQILLHLLMNTKKLIVLMRIFVETFWFTKNQRKDILFLHNPNKNDQNPEQQAHPTDEKE